MEQPQKYYRLPNHLRQENPELPEYIRLVFLDMTDLEEGELSVLIHAGLEQKHYLFVVCSPCAATSKWVDQEVETFISLGRTERIYHFIVEGNSPSEFFSPTLRNLPKVEERFGGDVNKTRKYAAFVKVVTGMAGVGFDSL